MECKQLIRLAKDWYIRIQQETMAPARMMEFVDRHVRDCPTCQAEEGLSEEIEKIRDFVLPESKIPKAVREQQNRPTPEIAPEEHNEIDPDGEVAPAHKLDPDALH
ncbi:MAG TPA: hypothetical protein ENI88_15395 [Desulfobulbus sp.]|nr:hypothetical protein [Desulfobulbus sp.]